MQVLVTGGAGYIGSVVVEELIRHGHEVVVYDNLSMGHESSITEGADFVCGDLRDTELLHATFGGRNVEAVIHMAAHCQVGESVHQPAKYYHNNVVAGLSLLDAMRRFNVRRIVFSSTAAVYGEASKHPIEEDEPTNPGNPYGETKLAFEKALRWYERAYGLHFASLRYFNAAGATQRCGELHDPETHLIPLVLQVAAGKRESVEIFGSDYPTRDGTCVRDYIHVFDLARAHILALDVLETKSATFNLGSGGEGYTVNEVIAKARTVTGKDIPTKIVERRAGDPAILVASSKRIKTDLGWSPQFQDLEKIIESAWSLYKKSIHEIT